MISTNIRPTRAQNIFQIVLKNILCANVFCIYYYARKIFLYAKNKLCG